MKLKAVRTGINGEGIAYDRKRPVFLPYLLPGETAEVRITERAERYSRAEVLEVLETSPERREAKCALFGSCGACTLQHASYALQKDIKKELIREALKKYAGITVGDFELYSGREYAYRNAAKLPLGLWKGKLVTGLYENGGHRFLAVRNCPIHEKELERIRKEVLNILNKHHLSLYDNRKKEGYRSLFLRVLDGEAELCLITGRDTVPDVVCDDLMKIEGLVSLSQSVNTERHSDGLFGSVPKILRGKKGIRFAREGLSLTLQPQSFFQLNTEMAMTLYRLAASFLEGKRKRLFEAYSGIGMISLLLREKAEEISGAEWTASAVEDANQNARENGAEHIHFLCGDAAEILERESRKKHFDTIVVDPPRSGMGETMCQAVLASGAEELLYISCNPATLAKDLQRLSVYEVQKIAACDLFPQTSLTETLVLLKSRKRSE